MWVLQVNRGALLILKVLNQSVSHLKTHKKKPHLEPIIYINSLQTQAYKYFNFKPASVLLCVYFVKVDFQSACKQGRKETHSFGNKTKVVLFPSIVTRSSKTAVHVLRWSYIVFPKKPLSVFHSQDQNRTKLLTGRSYYEPSSFCRYLDPSHWLEVITLVRVSSKMSAFSWASWHDQQVGTLSWQLIFWIPLEVLEYRLHGISYFLCFPQINWHKCLLSMEAIITEKCS